MLQDDKRYIHGSLAEKLEYNVYEENKVLKAKKTQKSYNKLKMKAIRSLFVIFIFAGILVFRYALITELNYKIDSKTKEYNTVRDLNTRLNVNIESKMNLNKIRERAEARLGMQKPDKYQIVYVNVPKKDFSVKADSDKENNDSGIISSLMDKVGKISQLLY